MFTCKNLINIFLITCLIVISAPSHGQTSDELNTMKSFMEIMDGYFNVIESTYSVAADNEKAVIVQMIKIQEVYEQMGKKADAATVFRGILKDSRNQTIRNAAYMLLADNLKDTGRADEAVKLLKSGLSENIALTN